MKPSYIVLLMLYHVQGNSVTVSPFMDLCVSRVIYFLKQQHSISYINTWWYWKIRYAVWWYFGKNKIFKWFQLIIWHAQQDKAKQDCLESLSSQTGLLIWDYPQKVLQMAFFEGHCNYFGKKRMFLHADFLLLKFSNQIYKYRSFTTACRSYQGIADSLTIANFVIKKIATDSPNLKELFFKSYNAGSYHVNFYVQSLYEIWKSNEIYLFFLY